MKYHIALEPNTSLYIESDNMEDAEKTAKELLTAKISDGNFLPSFYLEKVE